MRSLRCPSLAALALRLERSAAGRARGVPGSEAGHNGFHLMLTGQKFLSRHAAELYSAYRASEETSEQKGSWFTFTESRPKGDGVPAPKAIPPPTV